MGKKTLLLGAVAALVVGTLVQAYPRGNGADAYADITRQVFYHVQKKYVEPDRADPFGMLEGAFRAMENQFPEVLIRVDQGKKTARVQVDDTERTFELGAADRFGNAAETLNTVLAFVSANLTADVERKDLYYIALNGALDGLDPHSNVFSPKHFKEFMIGTRGTFGGIGFVFGIRDGEMTIITPIEGTPAWRGGLKSGDQILYIDGEPTINMAVDIAANKMRGEPGTQVTLTLERESWTEPKAVTFTREIIHVESVESYVLNGDGATPVVYAKVKNFQKDTSQELRKAVQRAEQQYPDLGGIILDLRNNPGGLLEQAIALSDGFMDRGAIVSTRGPEADANSRVDAKDDSPISRKPLIVLINQGSASASEIVSGALKESRALLVGQKSFGKGSVQKLYPLSDGGALKLTVAQYLTPGDISIQSIGIVPDIEVHPARIEPGKVRLGTPPSHMGEADLDNAFKEWGNSSGQAMAKVQYFEAVPEEDEEQRSFAELPREERLSRLAEDFPIRLARRILAHTDGKSGMERAGLIEAAKQALPALRTEEREKVAGALAQVGVDWSAGEVDGDLTLQVVLPAEVRLEAGATTAFPITVRNAGTKPAYRVWGRSESDNLLVKNLDFPFGRLDPGAEKTWTAQIEVPKSAAGRWDSVAITLVDGSERTVGMGAGGVLAVPVGKPEFAYRYEMIDENAGDPKRNGDGVLETGERVNLTLHIANRGDAASATAEVNIRSDEKEQLYLEAARQKLEQLAPGAELAAPMSFRLVQPADEGKVTVGVTVSDRDFGAFFGDSLTFHVDQPFPRSQARVPPVIRFTTPPPLHTLADKVSLEVVTSDDEAVKDFFAYLNDRKIRYERNRDGDAGLSVQLEVELKVGSNRLVLSARDSRDLRVAKTVHIFREAVKAALTSPPN